MTNTTEDEKRSSMGSPYHLESQAEIPPKNAFRNAFTWLCYEISHFTAFRLWALLCVPLGIWSRVSSNVLVASFFNLFAVMLLGVILFYYHFRLKRTISSGLDALSREIIAEAPGADKEGWDSVASHVNTYLYEKKLWNTKYYIYDGANCHGMFREHLLDPFTLQQDNPEKLRALETSIPCGEEALEVYRKEIDKRWKFMTSGKGSSANDLVNIKLPRDTCYNKLTWALQFYTHTPKFFALLLPYLFPIIYARNFESSLSRNAYVAGFFAFNTYLLYSGFDNRALTMTVENKMQFFSTIINAQNSIAGNFWDTVAKQMNSYLFEQKVWRYDQFFFDGAGCERLFRIHFADVPLKKRSPTGDLNCELWPYIEEASAVCTYDTSFSRLEII